MPTNTPQISQSVWSLIRTAWRNAPRVLRRFSIRIWVVATVIAAASIVADFHGFWRNVGFTANLFAEMIGAAIAAPVALLVISQLATYQTEEVARQRQDAQIRRVRGDLAAAAQAARLQIAHMDVTMTSRLDEFIEAIQPGNGVIFADAQHANEAAKSMRTLLHPNARSTIERQVGLARLHAGKLQDALTVRDTDGVLAAEIRNLAETSDDLRLAMLRLRRNMDHSYTLFGRTAWLNANTRARADEMRDTAIECLKSIDPILQHCHELERLSNDGTAEQS